MHVREEILPTTPAVCTSVLAAIKDLDPSPLGRERAISGALRGVEHPVS